MRNVSSGTIYYYEEDMLGSARTMVQAGQTSVCYDADFYPFGGERDITSTCTQNYKFEGKERDTETGNDDFGARYYTSRLGRWLSADWSAVPAPVPYANLTNPQTLNLYAMVSDNPETFADLDGHLSANTAMCWVDVCTGNSLDMVGDGYSYVPPNKNGTNTPLSDSQQAEAAQQSDAANANGQMEREREQSLSIRRAHKTYKWYQFFTKWADRWQEVETLRNEQKADRAIYDTVNKVVFDPIGNYNNPVFTTYAEISRLEDQNIYLDAQRAAAKVGGELPGGTVLGAGYDEIFNNAGKMRDANNKEIDRLLGEAANALNPSQ